MANGREEFLRRVRQAKGLEPASHAPSSSTPKDIDEEGDLIPIRRSRRSTSKRKSSKKRAYKQPKRLPDDSIGLGAVPWDEDSLPLSEDPSSAKILQLEKEIKGLKRMLLKQRSQRDWESEVQRLWKEVEQLREQKKPVSMKSTPRRAKATPISSKKRNGSPHRRARRIAQLAEAAAAMALSATMRPGCSERAVEKIDIQPKTTPRHKYDAIDDDVSATKPHSKAVRKLFVESRPVSAFASPKKEKRMKKKGVRPLPPDRLTKLCALRAMLRREERLRAMEEDAAYRGHLKEWKKKKKHIVKKKRKKVGDGEAMWISSGSSPPAARRR